jgi:hypothetical protein
MVGVRAHSSRETHVEVVLPLLRGGAAGGVFGGRRAAVLRALRGR